MTYQIGDRVLEIVTLGDLRMAIYHKHQRDKGFRAKWLFWAMWSHQ